MSERRATDLPTLSLRPDDDDIVVIVDVSDPSSHPDGTSKGVRYSDFSKDAAPAIIRLEGSYTDQERSSLTVPSGSIWIIYNETSGVLEYATDDNIWRTFGTGQQAGTQGNTIDGYTVKKGSGNTNATQIEVGDYCHGWNGDRFVAFKVDALPYTNNDNVRFAVKNGLEF